MELAEELEMLSLTSPTSSAALAGLEAHVAASSRLEESRLLASGSVELETESVSEITAKSDTLPSYKSLTYDEL